MASTDISAPTVEGWDFRSPEEKRHRELLQKDLERMEKGELGLSTAEKRQATDMATQQAAATLGAQQAEVARSALAAGPAGAFSGRAALLQQQLGGQLSNAAAAASADVERTSQELAKQEAEAIKARLETQYDRARQDAQTWGQLLLGGGMEAGGMIGAAMAACWVAVELWGEGDPRTHAARWYALSADTPFTLLYRRYGRAWAAWLRRNGWARPIAEVIWTRMAAKGRAMLEVSDG